MANPGKWTARLERAFQRAVRGDGYATFCGPPHNLEHCVTRNDPLRDAARSLLDQLGRGTTIGGASGVPAAMDKLGGVLDG